MPGSRILGLVVLLGVMLACSLQTQHPASAQTACGQWTDSIAKTESRLTIEPVRGGSGADCRGAFNLSNNTSVLTFGGYSLEVKLSDGPNTGSDWAFPFQRAKMLVPGVDLELLITPAHTTDAAGTTLDAAWTVNAVEVDTALFLMHALLDAIPGGKCFVPQMTLVTIAFRLATIFGQVVERVFKLDFTGASSELFQVFDAFKSQVGSAIAEAAVGCGADIAVRIIGEGPITVAEIIFDYLTWIPVAITHYFVYQGHDALATFGYRPAATAAATSTTSASASAPVPKPVPTMQPPTSMPPVVTKPPAGTMPVQPSTTSAAAPAVQFSVVSGRFFANPSDSGAFTVAANATPVFEQQFPAIAFNATPDQAGCLNSTGVTDQTRPFTDVVRHADGSCTPVVAQGNGKQAGAGDLASFAAAFTGTITVASAGPVTFGFLNDDGWILSIGPGPGGAQPRYQSGSMESPPPKGPLSGYAVVAADNVPNAESNTAAVVSFPAAGTYPFELDYTECCGGQLVLVMKATYGATQSPH